MKTTFEEIKQLTLAAWNNLYYTENNIMDYYTKEQLIEFISPILAAHGWKANEFVDALKADPNKEITKISICVRKIGEPSKN